MKLNIFWFRRDLRLEDNHGFFMALQSGLPVLPLFIFDTDILSGLPANDARVHFIHGTLEKMNQKLNHAASSILIRNGTPLTIWKALLNEYEIAEVFANHDYEPYAIKRDEEIRQILDQSGVRFHTFKDQVIFEKDEILKADGTPYTIYTPYKNRWLDHYNPTRDTSPFPSEDLLSNCLEKKFDFPTLKSIGFVESTIQVLNFEKQHIKEYAQNRDIPHQDTTTKMGPHLRFGTLSIRHATRLAGSSQVFLNELIWREFFMMILFHFPHVVQKSFKKKYDGIQWINDETLFRQWCQGKTGYPMVDAGMRQLNQTGFMHNRVRMVVASFLCKHLLIDWRWGEAYFAEKLLDYELASNNGNWQWAAGCGCDAAPYFRVFNPTTQLKKFDPEMKYVKKWIPELADMGYPPPIVEHAAARNRAIEVYKAGLNSLS